MKWMRACQKRILVQILVQGFLLSSYFQKSCIVYFIVTKCSLALPCILLIFQICMKFLTPTHYVCHLVSLLVLGKQKYLTEFFVTQFSLRFRAKVKDVSLVTMEIDKLGRRIIKNRRENVITMHMHIKPRNQEGRSPLLIFGNPQK